MGPSLTKVVLLPRRHADETPGATNGCRRPPSPCRRADEGQDLVGVGVHLFADLATGGDRHDHQLVLLAGPQHPAEVRLLSATVAIVKCFPCATLPWNGRARANGSRSADDQPAARGLID